MTYFHHFPFSQLGYSIPKVLPLHLDFEFTRQILQLLKANTQLLRYFKIEIISLNLQMTSQVCERVPQQDLVLALNFFSSRFSVPIPYSWLPHSLHHFPLSSTQKNNFVLVHADQFYQLLQNFGCF